MQALELDESSVPALVLLIYIDSNSTDDQLVPEWYTRLFSALALPVMHISDVKFIAFQNECVIQGTCEPPALGQERLLRFLVDKHPQHLHLQYQLALYCFMTDVHDCARDEAEALIKREPEFYPALELIYASYREEGEFAQAQETVRRLLLADKHRRMPGRLLAQSAAEL
jgi:hypothetical protein